MTANWATVESLYTAGESHPSNIRAACRDLELTNSVPEELQSITPEATVVLPERDGERVAKTVLRAASNGEGSDIAKKQLDGLARKHSTTVEELAEAAKAAAPETFFQFGPAQVAAIQDLYANQRNTVAAMVAYGFTREEIKNVFLKFTATI